VKTIALIAAAFLLASSVADAAQQRPPEYRLRWADEFNGNKLDTSKWRAEPRAGQVSVARGNLRLTASGKDAGSVRNGSVRSGDTRYLNSWKGKTGANKLFSGPGWMEFRVRTPDVAGVMGQMVLWTDWQQYPVDSVDRFIGEIDVAEARGHEPYAVWTSSHAWFYPEWTSPPIGFRQGAQSGIYRQRYHTYVVWWSADFVRIYVNGTLRHERQMVGDPAPVYGSPFAITMSCWVSATPNSWSSPKGVDWSRLPAHMDVDYVRYYAP
jgi:beta-glucanase (GH16 family)